VICGEDGIPVFDRALARPIGQAERDTGSSRRTQQHRQSNARPRKIGEGDASDERALSQGTWIETFRTFDKSMPMKTFEDFLKEFDETLRQKKDFAKGYKSFVDAHLAKLMMERIVRHPKFHCNMTADEAGITKAEMAEIIRQAETTAEIEMKSMIERHARDTYHRLVAIPETPDTKQ
jgi:hypothetical protein